MPPHSPVLEITNAEIWYEDDFHHLKFHAAGKLFEVRLYKVFTSTINGETGWMACPTSHVYEFAGHLREEAGILPVKIH